MIPLLLIIYLLIQLAQSVCVAPTPYLLAANSTCWTVCPWSPPTMYYASPLDNTCQTLCPSGWFGFDGNKTCTQTCPTSPNMTFYDTVNRKCVVSCPTGYFSYLGAHATSNQKCVSVCPAGTFAQQLNRQCVTTCPSNTFYKNDSTPFCVLRCPDNQYGSPIDKNCKVGGTCPTTPIMYFADDTTNMCVQSCPRNTFADITSGRCLKFCSATYFADSTTWRCVQNCPANYYRSNVTRSCLLVCTEGFFIDRLTGNCTQSCSAGTFGDFATGFCEEECTFPTFSDTVVGRCVNTCSFGLYANNFTSSCVTAVNCYANLIGDPTTRRCVEPSSNFDFKSGCPTAPYHFANLVAKLCTPKCPSPLWGDKSTKSCVSACPWNPATYVSWKNPDTQQCVTKCPEFPILYADNSTRTCVPTCPAASATVPYDTFADDISQECVRVCPNGFKSQKPQHICISQCSNTPVTLFFYHVNSSCLTGCPEGFYADSSRQVCTQVCPTNPDLFALEVDNTCVPQCPPGLYADSSTRRCVDWCPQTTLQYADNSTNECVDICPTSPDYYGLDRIDGNKVCVLTCSVGLFADPLTRTCVPACNIEEGYYGELTNPVRKCILECNANFYADNITKTCVSKCPDFPQKFYGNPFTKKCERICPEFLYGNSVTNVCGQPSACETGFFADDLTNRCVRICPISERTYGESTSRRCLKECPEGRFADDTTRRCEINCNATARLFRDPSTNRCVQNCPARPNLYNNPFTMSCDPRCTNGHFAYDVTRRCVAMCPSTPAFFGNIDTFRCVDKCPAERYRFVTNTQRTCRPFCPASYMGDTYADNTTWSCVTVCPEKENLYSFKHPTDATIRTCVKTCPVLNSNTLFYFADNVTQSCVQLCPLRRLSWGDKFTLKCERNCTRNQYRDNITVRCTYECSAPRYADNTTWDCVVKCPNGTYAYALGTNRTCLRECPRGFYADNTTNFCRSLCDNDVALWSDNTTWQCVKTCPTTPDLYADPNTDKCEFDCSGGLFADKIKRRCVPALSCSPGTIGDPRTYRCVTRCPIEVPSFWQVASNTCVTQCLPSFYADNSTMKCEQTCSSNPDYYAFNDTTLGPICVLYCPATYYRHLPNRTCLQACPAPDYFRDPTTMRCVKVCPDHYFAESVGQLCVTNCSGTSKYGLNNVCWPGCTAEYSADPTTFLCVKKCPFTYFSELNVCTQNCAIGYADPITKVCQPTICSLGYYVQKGTKKCVRECSPEYKYDVNQTCLPSCPKTTNHATNLYMDNNTYMCVNRCQPGWYADNNTGYCNTQCSNGLWADNSTGRCVAKCPATPDFYGYLKVCHFPCPKPDANTNLFAENTTRQCLLLCPNGSYADKYNRRCMDVCTLKQYAYTNLSVTPVHNLCVQMCPEGFYASDKSKSCLSVCDLGTYGENVTNKCLKTCPTGTYADDFLRLCVSSCDAGRMEFKDWSTQRCVKVCPSVPSLYAQNSSRSCVAACGVGWYGLNTTRVCTQNCPAPFYADPTTGFCELKCHIGTDRFADNVSRSCVVNCPNYTEPVTNVFVITYEDNSTKTCVKQCPFFPSLYGFNSTNACVEDCPSGTFGDNDTRLCLDKCFWNVTFNNQQKFTWADSATGFCTRQCTKGSFADNRTVSCVSNCSQGTFSENSTWRCVHNCPVNPVSFAKRQTRQCVQRCDPGFFGDELSRRCVNVCPKQPYFYYMDFLNQRCVKNCTSTATTQYFSEDLSQSCVTDCTIGYFKSLSMRACVKCPSSCLVCFAELNCTSCQPGLFLHDGSCIQSCPSFPIRYYANVLSSKCVKDCPSPYFGFNGTGKCELTCPEKYFSDITDNSCKLCNTGCRQCTTKLNCTSCLTGYVYVSQYNTCSKVCNITHIYYVDNKCQFSCIDGTFLLSDLVTCQKCSTACATCSMSGTNCTKCNNRFWYNFNCVTECPKGFYADSNNSCIDCNINQAACSVETLRYDVQTFTKDYKVFAFVKFNRPISLGKSVANRINSIYRNVNSAVSRSVGSSEDYRQVGQGQTTDEEQDFSTLMIIKTSKGPLKASSYRATKYNESVFLVQFFEATSLNEMALSVDFVPGSIVDTYGNGLADSSKTIQIATLQTVSLQVKQAAVEMKQNVNVLGWVLIVVLGLMMLKITYPLLVLIDFLQLIYMHLYIQVSPLPYFWMSIMSSMQNVNFIFFPSFHSQPDQSSANPYSYFKKDITMLGNIQPLVYIGGAFGVLYLIFWALSSCKIKALSCLRKRCKRLFKNRMRYSLLNEIFYYTQLQVFFFAVLQWPANRSVEKAAGNLATSIAVFVVYVAWLVFLLYKSSHYRKSLQSMPKRYNFLILQPSQFPLDIALRYTLKLLFCLCLLLPQKSIQLIFLITLNGVYFFYNLIYKPSLNKLTNYINMFVSLGLIGYQICLFAYGLTDKGATIQQQFSLMLLAIPGVVLVGIIAWILFRLFLFIKVDLLKIGLTHKEAHQMVYQNQQDYQKDKQIQQYQSTKNQNVFSFFNINKLQSSKLSAIPKSQYKKISSHHQKSLINDEDQQKSGKNMLPQLQFNHEDQDNNSQPQINQQQVMKQFSYHMVPKKNQALIKAEEKVMEKNQQRLGMNNNNNIRKKKLKGSSMPIVIAIDQNQLIDKNIQIIDKSKGAATISLQQPVKQRTIKSSKPKKQRKPTRIDSVIFNNNEGQNRSEDNNSDNIISVVNSVADLQQ